MAKNNFSIARAISDGTLHIICGDSMELDVRELDDNYVLLHHITKNGKPALNNRVKMKLKDAEVFVKKHGGIADMTGDSSDNVKPEVTADESKVDNYAPDAGYQFEDEKAEIPEFNDDDEEFEEPAEEEKAPAEEYNFDDDEEPADEIDLAAIEPSDDEGDENGDDFFSDDEENGDENGEEDPFEDEKEKEESNVEENYSSNFQDTYVPQGESIIMYDMTMTGDIDTKGSLNVMGVVSGNIKAEKAVTVSGFINGDIAAGSNITLTDSSQGAEIRGNIASSCDISIDARSVVIGDVAANNILVKGSVLGNIDTKEKITVCQGAHIKGNITSKEIQIEPGASIDGVCVQKYAEDNAENFFDNYTVKMTNEPLNKEKFGRNKNIGSKAEEIPMSELVEH